MMEEIVNAIYYFTDADKVNLFMVDELENMLWVAKSRGLDGMLYPLLL